MEKESKQQFFDLANKSLKGVCTPEECVELDRLLTAQPELKQEFEGLKKHIEVFTEVLLLARAMEAPSEELQQGNWDKVRSRIFGHKAEQIKKPPQSVWSRLRFWLLLLVVVMLGGIFGVIHFLNRVEVACLDSRMRIPDDRKRAVEAQIHKIFPKANVLWFSTALHGTAKECEAWKTNWSGHVIKVLVDHKRFLGDIEIRIKVWGQWDFRSPYREFPVTGDDIEGALRKVKSYISKWPL